MTILLMFFISLPEITDIAIVRQHSDLIAVKVTALPQHQTLEFPGQRPPAVDPVAGTQVTHALATSRGTVVRLVAGASCDALLGPVVRRGRCVPRLREVGEAQQKVNVARVASFGDRRGEPTALGTLGFEFHAVLHSQRASPARA